MTFLSCWKLHSYQKLNLISGQTDRCLTRDLSTRCCGARLTASPPGDSTTVVLLPLSGCTCTLTLGLGLLGSAEGGEAGEECEVRERGGLRQKSEREMERKYSNRAQALIGLVCGPMAKKTAQRSRSPSSRTLGLAHTCTQAHIHTTPATGLDMNLSISSVELQRSYVLT